MTLWLRCSLSSRSTSPSISNSRKVNLNKQKINLKSDTARELFLSSSKIHGVNVNSNILTFETVFPKRLKGETTPTKRGGKRNEKITWSIKYLWNNFSISAGVSMIISMLFYMFFVANFIRDGIGSWSDVRELRIRAIVEEESLSVTNMNCCWIIWFSIKQLLTSSKLNTKYYIRLSPEYKTSAGSISTN